MFLINCAFWKAAIERTFKTFAQAILALIGTGAVGLTDLDWRQLPSVAATAAVVSILTSVASGAASDGSPSLGAEALKPEAAKATA